MTGLRKLLASACLLALAGCNEPDANKVPLREPETPSPTASETAGNATPSPTPTFDLDYAALDDHTDPERLLRYYASAIREGAWADAAKAWSSDAEVTPAMLEKAYGRGQYRAELVFGKGDDEGAAGTLFHVSPVVADFPDETGEDERRGTIVLRRANDVPGASIEQLDWRIERSDVLVTSTPQP